MEADESVTIKVVDGQGAPVAGAAVGIVERIPLAGPFEELQARAEQMEAWVTGLRQWMSDNPKGAAEASGKLGGLQDALRETRQELAVARAEKERRSQQGDSSDQAPLSRLEVRTRRLTDEMGLAVVDHFSQGFFEAHLLGARRRGIALCSWFHCVSFCCLRPYRLDRSAEWHAG